ncbi:MAG: hypothetical protein WCR42_07780 [bacterium]
MKKILLIFLLIPCALISKEYKNWIYTADLYANNNFYASSFQKLPNVNNTSPNFSFAYGIMAGAGVGMEYKSQTKLFGMNWNYLLNLGFTGQDAKYSVTNTIGYDISENTYEELKVRNELKAFLPMVYVTNGLMLHPFELPLSIGLGLRLGWLISPKYEQSENMLNKDRFFENGTTQRDVSSGDLPTPNNLFSSLSLILRYKLKSYNDFDVIPNLSFNYGLTNIVKGLNWKVNNLQAGVTIAYNPSKPLPIPDPPKPPLRVVLPNPTNKMKEMDLKLNIYADNKLVANEPIDIAITQNYYYDEFIFPNEIYYDANQTDTLNYLAETIVNAIADKMSVDKDLTLTIIAKTPDLKDRTESNEIISKRTQNVVAMLNQNGIDSKRIKLENHIISEDFKYTELADESRLLILETSDKEKLIQTKAIKDVKVEVKKITLKIEPKIESEAGIKEFVGTVFSPVKSNAFADFGSNGVELFIDDSFLGTNKDGQYADEKLTVYATATDNDKISVKTERELIFHPTYLKKYTNSAVAEGRRELIVVGYSRFDKANFFSVNQTAKAKVINALAQGKKVYLIATTDDLGEQTYNDELAHRRMNSAIDYLGIDANKVEKIFKTNNTPKSAFDRVLSRGVYVEIE